MRRILVSLATAGVLATAVMPAVFAADPSGGDPVATPVPTDAAPQPTATPGPYDGTYVEDPTFVSGGELPTQPPGTGTVPGAAGLTPPPTDAPAAASTARAGTLLPLVLLTGAALVALLAGTVSPARRLPGTPPKPRRHRPA